MDVATKTMSLPNIIGNSSSTREIKNLINQVANSQANVLILGESGTGKELVACHIHAISNRRNNAFVPVNCAAIPSELLESELFGHEKGSFTGATLQRKGKFEYANGGTIFLDEIGDMPLSMQVKLLRVLQERSFERIGNNRSIKIDTRVIVATNKDLEKCVEEGSFREDLYYRINVFPIIIPPLRERKEDIIPLFNYFKSTFQEVEQQYFEIDDKALETLIEYNWPGNIRELSNTVERLLLMYPGRKVVTEMLPDKIKFNLKTESTTKTSDKTETIITKSYILDDNFNLKEHLASIEISLINQAMSDSNGVVAKAASALGIRRTTLVEKIKKYQLNFNCASK